MALYSPLVNSMMAAIAVLKAKRSISEVTFLMVAWVR